MPENYRIILYPKVGDEVSVFKAELYQPPVNELGQYVLRDEELLANMTPDPNGDPAIFYWHSALADATQPFKIVLLSEIGQSRNDEIAHSPRAIDEDTCTVEVWSIDAGLGVIAGELFVARPKAGYAVVGRRLVVKKREEPTDSQGYASLPIPVNAGVYRFVIGSLEKEIDTAVLVKGSVVNLKDL